VLELAPERILPRLPAGAASQPVIDEVLPQGGVDVVADAPPAPPWPRRQQREMADNLDFFVIP
jgi:hypothetical protein